jgi:hypothetical protein
MEMRERVPVRLADEEQVHDLAVIRDQWRPRAPEPPLVVDRELEPRILLRAHETRDRVERTIQLLAERAIEPVPPATAAGEPEHEDSGRGDHDEPRTHTTTRVGRLSRWQHALARRGADEREQTDAQEQSERDQDPHERRFHRQAARREHLHRQHHGALAAIAVHAHRQGVRRRRHEPERHAVEVRITRHGLCHVRRGRQSFVRIPCARLRRDLARTSSKHADVDLGESRNRSGRAHHDAHRIRTGVPFEPGVRATDVSGGRAREAQHEDHRRGPHEAQRWVRREPHRWTFDIHRP